MSRKINWSFPFQTSTVRSTDDLAVLERMDTSRMTDTEFGHYIRLLLDRGGHPCTEGEVFHGYCSEIVKEVEDELSLEAISVAKRRITDRYVHIMGSLPAAHYVQLAGHMYPFHLCVPEIFFAAYDHLNQLHATARSRSDFDGLVLGWEPQSS